MDMTPSNPPPPPSSYSNLSQQLAEFFNIRSATCTNLLIWTVGVVGLIGLSIRGCLPLLDEYREDKNVAIQVAVLTTPPPRPPAMSVCLPYHSRSLGTVSKWIYDNATKPTFDDRSMRECPECGGLWENSWDVWTTMDRNEMSDFLNTTIGDDSHRENILTNLLIKKLFIYDDFTAYLNLNSTNFNWNQPIFDAITKLLECRGIRDYTYLYDSNAWKTYNCTGIEFPKVENLNEKLDVLLNYSKKSIDLYLESTFGAGGRDSPLFPTDPLLERPDLFLSTSKICFVLSSNYSIQNFQYVSFVIREWNARNYPPWIRAASRSVPFTIWPDDGVLYAGVSKMESIYSTRDDDLARINHEDVSIYYSVDSRVIESRPERRCNPNPGSIEKCVLERQVRAAIRKCHCVPCSQKKSKFLEELDQDTNLLNCCDRSSYEKCQSEIMKNLNTTTHECSQKCESTIYNWRVKSKENHYDWMDMQFRVDIIAEKSRPYTEFVRILKNTPEQFLSQIAGQINLYLGFSGLSLCGLILFALELFKKSRANRNKNDRSENSDEAQGGSSEKKAEVLAIDSIAPRRRTNTTSEGSRFRRMEERMEGIEKEMRRIAAMLGNLERGPRR